MAGLHSPLPHVHIHTSPHNRRRCCIVGSAQEACAWHCFGPTLHNTSYSACRSSSNSSKTYTSNNILTRGTRSRHHPQHSKVGAPLHICWYTKGTQTARALTGRGLILGQWPFGRAPAAAPAVFFKGLLSQGRGGGGRSRSHSWQGTEQDTQTHGCSGGPPTSASLYTLVAFCKCLGRARGQCCHFLGVTVGSQGPWCLLTAPHRLQPQCCCHTAKRSATNVPQEHAQAAGPHGTCCKAITPRGRSTTWHDSTKPMAAVWCVAPRGMLHTHTPHSSQHDAGALHHFQRPRHKTGMPGAAACTAQATAGRSCVAEGSSTFHRGPHTRRRPFPLLCQNLQPVLSQAGCCHTCVSTRGHPSAALPSVAQPTHSLPVPQHQPAACPSLCCSGAALCQTAGAQHEPSSQHECKVPLLLTTNPPWCVTSGVTSPPRSHPS